MDARSSGDPSVHVRPNALLPRKALPKPSRLAHSRIARPSALVLHGLPSPIVRRIRDLAGGVSVTDASTIDELRAALDRSSSACLFIPVPGDHEKALLGSILRIRALYPSVPALACFLTSSSSYRATLVLGKAGVTELLSTHPQLQEIDLVGALQRCYTDSVTARVWERAELQLPDPLVSLLKAALRIAHAPVTAVALAHAAGMHERTLRKYCTAFRLPSPQWVIGWARLLIAAHYLDEPGRSIASVAELLGFPSTCALRNQLRRYAATSPTALRRGGVTSQLARTFEQSVVMLAAPSRCSP